jgi:hypothetical protein
MLEGVCKRYWTKYPKVCQNLEAPMMKRKNFQKLKIMEWQ